MNFEICILELNWLFIIDDFNLKRKKLNLKKSIQNACYKCNSFLDFNGLIYHFQFISYG